MTPSLLTALVLSNGTDEMLRDASRKLLRLSLQDPRFRLKFNEYFASHPMDDVREEGQRWLSEVLVWED